MKLSAPHSRRAAAVITALVMAWWAWARLRDQLPMLAVLTAVATAAFCLIRFRRDLAAAVTISLTCAAVPVVVMLEVLEVLQRDPTAVTAAAILTSYALIAPAPTVTAWTLRPALVSRARCALLGSVVLLLTAVPAVLLPVSAPLLLPASAIATCAGIWLFNHRRRTTGSGVNLGQGWTDLGARQLPGGQRITHLVIGHGHAVAAVTATARPTRAAFVDAVRRAATAADAIDLPVARMQPVLLSDQVRALPTPHLINTGDVAAMVILARPDQLSTVAAAAPRRRWSTRRNLRLGQALPTPKPRAAVAV